MATTASRPAPGVHGLLDHVVAVFVAANIAGVGDGVAAGGLDFVDDFLRGRGIGAFAGNAAAEVVDDDFGAVPGDIEGVSAAEAAAGASDEGHLAFKGNCHEKFLQELSMPLNPTPPWAGPHRWGVPRPEARGA